MRHQSIYYCLLFLGFIFCSINVVKGDAESRAIDIIKEYYDIPRYTYFTSGQKLTKYPKGFCGGESVDNCNFKQYGEAIVLLSGVTLIIGLITLIFGVIFWVFRGLIFGGCQPTHGILCPGPKYDPDIGEGYKTRHVWILKIAVFFIAIGCVPLFIASITGNSQTTSNITELGDIIIDKADNILEQMQNFSNALSNPKFTRFESTVNQIKTELDQMITDGNEVKNHGEDITDITDKFNRVRNDIVLAGFIVGIVVTGLIALSALCNLPKISCYGALALIILIPFTWIVFSAHYPINSFLADVCISYNTTGGVQFSDFDNPLIQEVISDCNANPTNIMPVFKSIANLVDSLEQNGEEITCGVINTLCNNLTYPYYAGYDYNQAPTMEPVMVCPPGTCDITTLPTFINSSQVQDALFGCKYANTTQYCNLSLPPTDCLPSNGDQIISCDYNEVPLNLCVDDCANTAYQSNSSLVVEGADTLVALSDLWRKQITPVIRCSNLIPFVNQVQDLVCVKEVNSLTLLVAPSGIFAIFLTILGVLAVLGSKRFNVKARANNISRQQA